MNVDGVNTGIVLDHIHAGKSMVIYKLLGLDRLDCTVAVIQNVKSAKYGRKDIIKIDKIIDLDFDAIGFVDPNITVNIVKEGKLARKSHVSLPDELTDVLRCRNPRCITSSETDLPQRFKLVDPEKRLYRCVYCDAMASEKHLF
ncbi:aspartate carbamoyltransferase regulatory subunit [Mobilibacterium timonense]|jgi:aspartate carbamoyltransferase regulatory subunit|uniref:aspartate carbamoyltransferase regulatory subunit n=1 Tax=Mobilibacterium timonense TaxID=1871012 RepID=UPI0009875F4C|nr:aspartate carbamoyltransferase regulatory subunit [Mobilibacterium timonense]MBM6990783.1 aspartate carbamoyltransferase regulatory subunit [Mobilibacterium timonense]